MIPRGKLDIPYSKLFLGMGYCISDALGFKKSQITKADTNSIPCLSIRTGLDLTLSALKFPTDSEILVSDINIPDMFSILSAHQMISIPLAINKRTLAIEIAEIESLITPNTRAILITHLFGGIVDTGKLILLARKHNLIVLEDCAQAFNGTYNGNDQSDVVMFSFGLIKTNTSLTGALLHFNNASLYDQVKSLNDDLPVQQTGIYFKKIIKALIIKLITQKYIFTALYKVAKITHTDFDDLLASFSKGFPGADVMRKIKYRPCAANLRLLENRINSFAVQSIKKRSATARQILENIPDRMKIGNLNKACTYWVIPISCDEPANVVERLRSLGCDATMKASSLVRLPDTSGTMNDQHLNLDNLVYLPIHRNTAKTLKNKIL